jgi:hypothetical protein
MSDTLGGVRDYVKSIGQIDAFASERFANGAIGTLSDTSVTNGIFD